MITTKTEFENLCAVASIALCGNAGVFRVVDMFGTNKTCWSASCAAGWFNAAWKGWKAVYFRKNLRSPWELVIQVKGN